MKSRTSKIITISLIGILGITLIDTVGAYLSGVFNFSFSYFTPVIIIAMFILGFIIMLKFRNIWLCIIIPDIIGLYDLFIGWKLYEPFGANISPTEKSNISPDSIVFLIIAVLIPAILGVLGGLVGLIYLRIRKKENNN